MKIVAFALIGTPLVLAPLALVAGRRGALWAARVALLAAAVVLALGVDLAARMPAAGTVIVPVAWLGELGVSASLRVDRLGVVFVLLVGGVGLTVVAFARHYLGDKARGPFWALLIGFMGAMLGVVLADGLIVLFVAWELTTVASALLIGGTGFTPEGQKGALQAFLVTGGGGLLMLAGIVLLGLLAGTTDLSGLETARETLARDPRHLVPLALVLAGAFTKSAQVPFHFWLPGAMAAPAPVSAYLHSATMVKAGVFLLARLWPVFGASPAWRPTLVVVGLTTAVVGGVRALRAVDVKLLLAHSTVSQLGLITAALGFGARGALVMIVSHALYKSALFLLVGWLEKATGTRDLRALAAVRWARVERAGVVLFAAGAAALASVPLTLAFVAKELLFEAVLGGGAPLAAAVVTVASALSVGYALKLVVTIFGGVERPPRRVAPRPSAWLLVLPGLLLAPQLLAGLWPAPLVEALLGPGASWPPGPAWFHHLDVALALGLASYAGGVLAFAVWRPLARLRPWPGAEAAADGAAAVTLAASGWLARAVQRGGHPRYLAVILVSAAAASVAALAWPRLPIALPPPELGAEAGLALVPCGAVTLAAVGAVLVPARVSKAILVGIAGYGVALLYVLFRAPDLALTQILVETVSLILLLLIFRRMPVLGADERPVGQRLVHGAVALAMGGLAATLAWWAGVRAAPDPVGLRELALAVPEGGGHNAVNVILVDFRAIDTLGEITVLSIAALAALVFLRTRGEAAR